MCIVTYISVCMYTYIYIIVRIVYICIYIYTHMCLCVCLCCNVQCDQSNGKPSLVLQQRGSFPFVCTAAPKKGSSRCFPVSGPHDVFAHPQVHRWSWAVRRIFLKQDLKPPRHRLQEFLSPTPAGWWFGTCFIFPYMGIIIPIDSYFSEG